MAVVLAGLSGFGPVGCAGGGDDRDVLEVRLAWSKPEPGAAEAIARDERRVWVAPTSVLDASDVRDARATLDALGRPAVLLELTDEAAAELLTATTGHVGEPLALMVRGELVNAPIVHSPLSRQAIITGLDDDEVAELVALLRKG